jgi:hypothetical protein
VMGSLGLAAFGLIVWLAAPRIGFSAILLAAAGWAIASMVFWYLQRHARHAR